MQKNIIMCFLSVGIAAIFLFPLYWIVVTSLKAEPEVFQNPPTFIPETLNFKSYTEQLSGDFNMFQSFKNSFVIATSTMLLCVVLAVPASYGIGRYRFKGRSLFLLIFLLTQMLPASVILTPLFIIFNNLGLLNTQIAVILADATIGIPFSILVLMNFFASIPKELEDSARIDGCNRFTAFLRVFLPIAYPGGYCLCNILFLICLGRLSIRYDIYSRSNSKANYCWYIQFYGSIWYIMELFNCICNSHHSAGTGYFYNYAKVYN
ncbi:maltose/maltodextrin ABC transporter [Gracilibacillus boraciitolerans JCM 21714]|uniref:Maltose/maltodextrin ABC transporter n=2 Tax=Gracilibacillus boraciitolerans TaxID=307521 RepID=W4VQ06_9BACI|nr:maltose/maltodextrin ABC transporter [Gracilibacillus boraciitolerans JCM 21714]